MKIRIISTLLLVFFSALLRGQQNKPRLVLPLEQKILNSRYSTDGNYVLVADAGTGHTRLYNSSTGKELKTLSGYLLKKAFLSQEKKIEITRSDSAIHFWDMNSDCSEKLCIRLKRTLYSPFIYDLYEDSLIIKSIPDTTGSTYKAAVYEVKSNKILVEMTGHTQPIQSINFSSSGKRLVSSGYDSTARIWRMNGLKNPIILSGHRGLVFSAVFSPDEKYVLTASTDSTAALYETNSGKRIITFKGHEKALDFAFFSPKGNLIVTGSDNSTLHIWNAQSGKLISVIHQQAKSDAKIFVSGNSGMFSPDEKYLIIPFDSSARIWEVKSGKLMKVLIGHSGNVISSCFSPDGKQILTSSEDNSVRIWETSSGLELKRLGGYTTGVNSVQFSPDNDFIISAFEDSAVRMWDFRTGKPIRKIKIPDNPVFSAELSRDGKIFLVARGNYKARIFETATGKLLRIIKTLKDSTLISSYYKNKQYKEKFKRYYFPDSTILDATLSPDGNSFGIVCSGINNPRIFDIKSGNLIHSFKPILWTYDDLSKIKYCPDGKYIMFHGYSIYDLKSEKLIFHMKEEGFANFSPDGRYLTQIVGRKEKKVKSYDLTLLDSLRISIVNNNIPLSDFDYIKFLQNSPKYSLIDTFPSTDFQSVKFSSDGNLALVFRKPHFDQYTNIEYFGNDNNIVEIWNLSNGKKKELKDGHLRYERKFDASFSFDGKYVLTTSADHQTILWETATGRRLYTRLQLKGDDYLIYDEHYRFDGTPGAMEKLYFVCGLEATELGQIKDALYVPGLAEKIINGEEINYKKLSDLDFCNALPLLENWKEDAEGREFRIQQRRWPINRLEIKVGGKTVKTIPAEKLGIKNNLAILRIRNAELEKFLVPGVENTIEVLAFTKENGTELQSQRLEFSLLAPKFKAKPRLFMLLIGVNDYKDDDLDLHFPVQDARTIGNALKKSAGKLLGDENVEVFHVQSRLGNQPVFTTPERAGVMKALEEIGKKARSQDVLFIFFAGHGVMQGASDKTFTFLTADASRINPVGISTTDLKEWLSPEGPFQMMPNKTILVYDACNSGQAAKELVSALMRDNDATERRRQIEDHGDKSGLFILSASAPDKPAYEIPKLGQGLLTYSMLYALKNNLLILDDNVDGKGFLNLQKWFLETEREQNRIMTGLGLRQKAQPYGSANIRIGIVDEDLRKSISLLEEKPLVYCSNARDENDEDPLDLKNKLNDFLENGHARGINSGLAFVPAETSGANVVKIVYSLRDGKVSCRVLVFKNKNKIQEISIDATEPELLKRIVSELEVVCK